MIPSDLFTPSAGASDDEPCRGPIDAGEVVRPQHASELNDDDRRLWRELVEAFGERLDTGRLR